MLVVLGTAAVWSALLLTVAQSLEFGQALIMHRHCNSLIQKL